jgi:uncharacterized protein (TIGR02646 family)
MRRIQRLPLPVAAQRYLDDRQARANAQLEAGTLNITSRWEDARGTKKIAGDHNSVLSTLEQMAGSGKRCMYCSDSRGGDIEHFRPKALHPEHAFCWPNLLLCCTRCGCFKLDDFPLDGQGQPLFIDPSVDDPWQHLDFDPDTGMLCPKVQCEPSGALRTSARGVQTCKTFRFAEEATQEGARRTFRHLRRCVSDFLAEQPTPQVEALWQDLREEDTRGLLPWCWGEVGRALHPFAELHTHFPTVWHTLAERIHPAP